MKGKSIRFQTASLVLGLLSVSGIVGFIAIEQLARTRSNTEAMLTEVLPRIEEGTALRDLLRRLAIAEKSNQPKEVEELAAQFTRAWDKAVASASGKRRDILTHVGATQKKWQTSTETGRDQAMQELQLMVGQLAISDKRYLDEESEQTKNQIDQAYVFVIAIVLAGVFAGAVFGYWMMSRLSNTLTRVMNRLTNNFESLDQAAQNLVDSSQDLSSVNDMNLMVKRNVESARDASQRSVLSEQKAKKGKEVVEDMIKAVHDINEANNKIVEQVNQTSREIHQVVNMISEIGEKTKVINEIVLQTKILSFNASVEASKAGEHGKGFAVVADEVRSLTQMSGRAAREISELISKSTRDVENILRDTQSRVERLVMEGTAKVDIGAEIATHCGNALDEIVDQVGHVNQIANQIVQSSHDQEHEIGEIVMVSRQVGDVGHRVYEQSQTLRQVVDDLTKLVQGRNRWQRAEQDARRGSGPVTISDPATHASQDFQERQDGLTMVDTEPVLREDLGKDEAA